MTLYTAGHLHTAVPYCSHSRAPIVHTAVPRENNEHGCVYLRCRAVCKLPGCVEGHPWYHDISSGSVWHVSIFQCATHYLTHWGRVTHICVTNLTIIGSDNGLSPGRRQAITWTNVGILLIWPLGTNFSEMFIEIQTFSFNKIHLKMSSGKWRPFCLGLNVLSDRIVWNLNHYYAESHFDFQIWWNLMET